MCKIKTYMFSDFTQIQDEAVQYFLHSARDHMIASQYLFTKTVLIESAAYLCNMAFELLLKAMHLSENGKYRGIHKLMDLYNGLNKKWIAKKDLPLIKVIDRCSLIRYPIDQALSKSGKVRKGGLTYAIGEIGTDDLEAAEELFCKIWGKLAKNKQFKSLIQNIKNNPYKKGNRILMQKKR